MRETRESASEVKFLVDRALAPQIAAWARTQLHADPHGAGPFGDEYRTASLYFDTRDQDVYHRRGSFGRAKYRIRRYGDGDRVYLERKLRRPPVLIKRRTAAPLALLARLDDAAVDPAWAGAWFHARLLARRLVPSCQVSYHRMARQIVLPEGTARLTLDADLRAAPASRAGFIAVPGVSFLEDRAIVELKFRGLPPAIFRRLVEAFALAPVPVSKYRYALDALGLVRTPGGRALPAADASYA